MERQEFLEMLKESRDGYSDEIPREILHATKVVGGKKVHQKYKVRSSWFQNRVYCVVELGLDAGHVSEEAKRMFEDFRRYAEESELSRRLTVGEDIDRANSILTKIINDLEGFVGE